MEHGVGAKAEGSPGDTQVTVTPTPMPTRTPLRHRGFDFAVQPGPKGTFAFAVSHRGLPLHASASEFRSVVSADRAARRFVDDALGVFAHQEAAAAV